MQDSLALTPQALSMFATALCTQPEDSRGDPTPAAKAGLHCAAPARPAGPAASRPRSPERGGWVWDEAWEGFVFHAGLWTSLSLAFVFCLLQGSMWALWAWCVTSSFAVIGFKGATI